MQCGTLTVPLDHHFHATTLVPTTTTIAVYLTSDSPTPTDPGEPTWKRLASRAFLPHEVASLIEATLMSQGEVKMIGNLCGGDAQSFVDVIHEVPSQLLHF